jgi:hypothetical protein
MKSSKRALYFLLISLGWTGIQGAWAQQKQIGGPKFAQSMFVVSLLSPEQEAQLTPAERAEVSHIEIFQDSQDLNTYYYIPPVVVAGWVENRYSINLELQERLTKRYLEFLDQKEEDSALKSIALRTLSGEDVNKQTEDLTTRLNQMTKAEAALAADFLSYIQAMRGLMPAPYVDLPATQIDEAFTMASAVLNKVPSVRAQVKLAWGFTQDRAAAFTKLKAIRSDLKFIALPGREDYILKSNGPIIGTAGKAGDTEEQIALTSFESSRKAATALFQNIYGLRVPNAGTTVGMDLYYNLAREWGYSKDNRFQGAGALALEGSFVTRFPISARFEGKVECNFKASVIRKKLFSVEQMPDTALMVDTSEDIDSSERKSIECDLYDSSGRLLSKDGLVQSGHIDASLVPKNISLEEYVRTLNAQIQSHIANFTKEHTTDYQAAVSLADNILARAEQMADEWFRYPVPTTEALRQKLVTEQECKKFPRIDGCLRHGWKKGHGIKSLGDKWICKEDKIVYDEQCKDVQKLVVEAYRKPISVKAFKMPLDFVRNYDIKTTYPIAAATQYFVEVKAPNDTCFKREEIDAPTNNNPARFVACDGATEGEAKKKAIDDVAGNPNIPQPASPVTAESSVVFY